MQENQYFNMKNAKVYQSFDKFIETTHNLKFRPKYLLYQISSSPDFTLHKPFHGITLSSFTVYVPTMDCELPAIVVERLHKTPLFYMCAHITPATACVTVAVICPIVSLCVPGGPRDS